MTDSAPRYEAIAAALRQQLSAGVYPPGARVPSENELTMRFGVSRPTAARALRELETEGLVERRPGSGTYVTQPPRPRASGYTYGLLVQGLGATEVLDPICTEIIRLGQQDGSTVLWGDTTTPRDAVDEVDRQLDHYVERRVDGVFFAPLESVPNRERENTRIAQRMRGAGIEVILLDRDVTDFPGRSDFDLVGIDNVHAAMTLTQHLLDVGHTRLCFLAKPLHPSTTDLRAIGCQVAMQRAGIALHQDWQVSADPTDDAIVAQLLRTVRPDAIVCSNDLSAALLIQTLLRLGVAVPGEVAVVGFDDVVYSTLLSVALTTMRQPFRGIARVAVRAMQDRLEGRAGDARQLLLKADLIVRQSCGVSSG